MLEVVPDASAEVAGERASGSGVLVFSIAVFLVSLCVVMGLSSLFFGEVGIVAIACSFAVAMLATMSAHIAQQWERVVVLRLGKFNRVSGPGLYWTIPIIEQNAMRVDTRIRSTTFGAEETLTSDLVPINVNAVLFWMVWDAKAACTEVGDFSRAVELAAQTALRDAIGRAGAAEVAIRREQLDRELKSTLEEKVALWGITILSVEVRDILLPEELQDVMSLEAQAEQRKKARIILMEAEQDISDMLDNISKAYDANDSALRLRAMHLLYESVRETGGTVVVPSSFSEGFGDVLPDTMKGTLGHK
ncbi:slipin family protein [Ellagibacter isourolithinifaciens]|uniref:slipin family protein n=1 Tax=Ellagibacter isourolithinifaciens TaxID=2137581 RepID=UPI003AAA836A